MTDATLTTERELARDGARYVVGIDEVGRGAIAGPVHVGAVFIDMRVTEHLGGVRDSKALTERQRVSLVPVITSWSTKVAVGSASNEEIDQIGIIAAMARAAERALESFGAIDAIILDGKHNWLKPSMSARVLCAPRADARDLSVAAASVLAKVQRDATMVDLHRHAPVYNWARNKGYGSPQHLAALRLHGVSAWHRRTWNIPGASTASN